MDIVERLREQANVAENWLQRPQAVMADTMNEAAAEIEQLREALAARDAGLKPFRVGDYFKTEEDLTEYRRAIIEGEQAEIAAWLRRQAEIGDERLIEAIEKYGKEHNRCSGWAGGVVAIQRAATAIASGEYRKGEG